jgi:tRNA(Ile)-lysidine synthase
MMKPKLVQRIRQFIDQFTLLAPGDSVLLAVSGGPDSVALLILFNHYLKALYRLDLFVAHLNHGLRDKAADHDEQFVKSIAKELGLPCFIKKTCIRKKSGESLENKAREVRYHFLENVAKKAGIKKIATAHHQDDQAETVLMHLLAGSGSTGLMGVRPVHGNVIRPLLGVSKAALIDFLKVHRQSYCVDKSNNDIKFLRNRIRHKLLPYLKMHFGHHVSETVSRLALNTYSDAFIRPSFIKMLVDKMTIKESRELREIDFNQIRLCPALLLKPVLQSILAKFKSTRLTTSLMNDFRKNIILGKTGGAVIFPGNIRAERSYEAVVFSKKTRKRTTAIARTFPKRRGTYRIGPRGPMVKISLVKNRKSICFPAARELRAFFDFDKIADTIQLRNRKRGDRFFPLGAPGIMKLKDFFINEKIPREKREKFFVFESKRSIFWVAGLRIAESFRVGQRTRKILVVEVEN